MAGGPDFFGVANLPYKSHFTVLQNPSTTQLSHDIRKLKSCDSWVGNHNHATYP